MLKLPSIRKTENKDKSSYYWTKKKRFENAISFDKCQVRVPIIHFIRLDGFLPQITANAIQFGIYVFQISTKSMKLIQLFIGIAQHYNSQETEESILWVPFVLDHT